MLNCVLNGLRRKTLQIHDQLEILTVESQFRRLEKCSLVLTTQAIFLLFRTIFIHFSTLYSFCEMLRVDADLCHDHLDFSKKSTIGHEFSASHY